jgi:uncharacterized membrane protein
MTLHSPCRYCSPVPFITPCVSSRALHNVPQVRRPTKQQIATRLVQVARSEGMALEQNAAEMLVEQVLAVLWCAVGLCFYICSCALLCVLSTVCSLLTCV